MATGRGTACEARRSSPPQLIDLEIVSVWRRLELAGHLDGRRVDLALADLVAIPLRRISHRPFLPRCWALRPTLTAYDAAYVVIVEAVDATLVTADARLARAPGPTCPIQLLEPVDR